jgi:hypothetical protein
MDLSTKLGWQGWMKPAGMLRQKRAERVRHSMPLYVDDRAQKFQTQFQAGR